MPDTLDSINSTTIIYCFREAKFTKGSKRSRNKQSRRQERKEETRNRPHLPEVSEPGSCCSWIRIAERKKLSIHQGLPSPAQTILLSNQKSGDENSLCSRDYSILFSHRKSGDENTLCHWGCSIASSSSLGFYEGDGVRAMGDASKTPTPKKHTLPARQEIWRTRTWVSTKRPG
jgi:hypothetical protein